MPQFSTYLSKEKQDELRKTAQAIVTPGKGILAADESTGQLIHFLLLTAATFLTRRRPKCYSSCCCCCCCQFCKMPKAFLICSGEQRNFAYTFVLRFPTDLPSQIFKLMSSE